MPYIRTTRTVHRNTCPPRPCEPVRRTTYRGRGYHSSPRYVRTTGYQRPLSFFAHRPQVYYPAHRTYYHHRTYNDSATAAVGCFAASIAFLLAAAANI